MRTVMFLVSVLFLAPGLPAMAGERAEICHFSPGGSGSRTITVSAQSAERHMIEHGDHIGACLVGAIPLSKVYITSLSANDVIVFNGDTYTQIDTLATKKPRTRPLQRLMENTLSYPISTAAV